MAPGKPQGKTSDHLKGAWPLLKELIRPRQGKIAFGFLLMGINKLCGLVLPGSTKFLIDNVINQHQVNLLMPRSKAVGTRRPAISCAS